METVTFEVMKQSLVAPTTSSAWYPSRMLTPVQISTLNTLRSKNGAIDMSMSEVSVGMKEQIQELHAAGYLVAVAKQGRLHMNLTYFGAVLARALSDFRDTKARA